MICARCGRAQISNVRGSTVNVPHSACVWAFLVGAYGEELTRRWPESPSVRERASVAFASVLCKNFSSIKEKREGSECAETRRMTESLGLLLRERWHRVVVVENVPSFFK